MMTEIGSSELTIQNKEERYLCHIYLKDTRYSALKLKMDNKRSDDCFKSGKYRPSRVPSVLFQQLKFCIYPIEIG